MISQKRNLSEEHMKNEFQRLMSDWCGDQQFASKLIKETVWELLGVMILSAIIHWRVTAKEFDEHFFASPITQNFCTFILSRIYIVVFCQLAMKSNNQAAGAL